jgi:hypothetical protein
VSQSIPGALCHKGVPGALIHNVSRGLCVTNIPGVFCHKMSRGLCVAKCPGECSQLQTRTCNCGCGKHSICPHDPVIVLHIRVRVSLFVVTLSASVNSGSGVASVQACHPSHATREGVVASVNQGYAHSHDAPNSFTSSAHLALDWFGFALGWAQIMNLTLLILLSRHGPS